MLWHSLMALYLFSVGPIVTNKGEAVERVKKSSYLDLASFYI